MNGKCHRDLQCAWGVGKTAFPGIRKKHGYVWHPSRERDDVVQPLRAHWYNLVYLGKFVKQRGKPS